MATLMEKRAPASRKYVAEQGMVMPNWWKTFQTFWLRSSVFAFERQPKNLNYSQFFLPLRDPSVATFNETRAPTSKKELAEQGILMQNWSKTFESCLSHFSVFALEKQPES